MQVRPIRLAGWRRAPSVRVTESACGGVATVCARIRYKPSQRLATGGSGGGVLSGLAHNPNRVDVQRNIVHANTPNTLRGN